MRNMVFERAALRSRLAGVMASEAGLSTVERAALRTVEADAEADAVVESGLIQSEADAAHAALVAALEALRAAVVASGAVPVTRHCAECDPEPALDGVAQASRTALEAARRAVEAEVALHPAEVGAS